MGNKKTISRRNFIKAMGIISGAVIVPPVNAQTLQLQNTIRNLNKFRKIHIPGNMAGLTGNLIPRGGDQIGTPKKEKRPYTPDDPPGFGPYIVMDHPAYYQSLYANRFFNRWEENRPGWFGQVQYNAALAPSSSWLAQASSSSPMCAVSTIWNKGRQPAFGVMMRGLCFVMGKKTDGTWEEIVRHDLGYVCIGTIPPNNYLEVRYPAFAVREGMKIVDKYLIDHDPDTHQWPEIWFFHKCFAFEPISDPLDLSFPIRTRYAPKKIIGGRHGGGWRWPLPSQPRGTARSRLFF